MSCLDPGKSWFIVICLAWVAYDFFIIHSLDMSLRLKMTAVLFQFTETDFQALSIRRGSISC